MQPASMGVTNETLELQSSVFYFTSMTYCLPLSHFFNLFHPLSSPYPPPPHLWLVGLQGVTCDSAESQRVTEQRY